MLGFNRLQTLRSERYVVDWSQHIFYHIVALRFMSWGLEAVRLSTSKPALFGFGGLMMYIGLQSKFVGSKLARCAKACGVYFTMNVFVMALISFRTQERTQERRSAILLSLVPGWVSRRYGVPLVRYNSGGTRHSTVLYGEKDCNAKIFWIFSLVRDRSGEYGTRSIRTPAATYPGTSF